MATISYMLDPVIISGVYVLFVKCWRVLVRQSKVLEMVEKNYRIHCSVANIVRNTNCLL